MKNIKTTTWIVALSFACVCNFTASAFAQEDFKRPAAGNVLDIVPLALVVSGGVSLGSYEGGLLYYELGLFKQHADLLDLKAAGGASAGSLNSLLSILAYCGEDVGAPEESLFWKTWINLGLEALFTPSEANTISLFHRHYFEAAAERIREAWEKGLSPKCDIVWGVSTTRVYPRSVSIAEDRLHLPRTEEKFSVHIRGGAPGQSAIASNFIDPQYALEQTMLAESAKGELDFSSLRDLTFASCSFPLAFKPQVLAYCVASGVPGQEKQCRHADSIEGLFIDGGIFDNTPLRLTARLMGAGLRKQNNGSYIWEVNPDLDRFSMPDSARFLFVTPDATNYPLYDDSADEVAPESVPRMVEQLMSTFISTSRTKELYTVLEERPELRDRIYIPRRHYPTLSGLLYAFFGFVEQDFRIFDFYLGMFDARHNFFDDVQPRLEAALSEKQANTIYPEDLHVVNQGEVDQWKKLRCMRSVYENKKEYLNFCEGEAMYNFRILIQVSLERLFDNCARLNTKSIANTTNKACLAANRGERPPLVPGVFQSPKSSWQRVNGEQEFDYVLRLLAGHRFHFKDLGLAVGDGWRAPSVVRERAEDLATAISKRQPFSQRHAVKMGGQILADAIVDAPPAHTFYLHLSRHLELGHSGSLHASKFMPNWLRVKGGLLVGGMGDLLSSQGAYVSAGPVLGLEFFPARWQSPLVKGRLSLSSGFLFSTNDRFGISLCKHAGSEKLNVCSRLMVQSQAGIVALDYLRFYLSFDLYPDIWGERRTLWSLAPGMGVQF